MWSWIVSHVSRSVIPLHPPGLVWSHLNPASRHLAPSLTLLELSKNSKGPDKLLHMPLLGYAHFSEFFHSDVCEIGDFIEPFLYQHWLILLQANLSQPCWHSHLRAAETEMEQITHQDSCPTTETDVHHLLACISAVCLLPRWTAWHWEAYCGGQSWTCQVGWGPGIVKKGWMNTAMSNEIRRSCRAYVEPLYTDKVHTMLGVHFNGACVLRAGVHVYVHVCMRMCMCITPLNDYN